ncbi:MAG: ABC transporter substrate-binding protein [Polyangiaceae bacterium]|nr:ABC transporter substrate-binding protein [Polyangiaceae bacterium]
MRRRGLFAFFASLAAPSLGCGRGGPSRSDSDRTIVFKHQPLWGDPEPFRAMLSRFEAKTGYAVVTEALPSSSDAAHQYFLTSLEGGDASFDVLVADVVWVPEFARAGWIRDLSEVFPSATIRGDFVEGAANGVIVDDRTFAVPWYADVGLLYRRTDLVPDAPRTYDDLAREALAVKERGAVEYGYVWQGRQYEGLVCNVFEVIWGHGGAAFENGRLQLDVPEARDALRTMRSFIERGVSPRSVTAMAEEESRRPFQAGRAAFMRNWPYALVEAARDDSPIRGKVAVSSLPTRDGTPGHGTLGGYQLAVNAAVTPARFDGAVALVEHLTSLESNISMAVLYGRNPPRRAAYASDELRSRAPHVAAVEEAITGARPRPVTPYYALLADTLQSELSAAVSGIRTPEEALQRAQRASDRIMGMGAR